MPARVAAIGLTSWDRIIVVDHYPDAGSYAIIRKTTEQSGGTTANTAHALSRLGVPVTLAAMVGDDAQGNQLRDDLAAAGCDISYVRVRTGEPSDTGVIVVSGLLEETDRTIFWQQGARLRMGDALPINELFEHDLVILDVDDERLRRFIVDLPMHVAPRTRVLGTLTYLTELPPREALDVALRYNYIVGNERELRYITGTVATDQALSSLRARMSGADARLAAISLGARGCVLMTMDETVHLPAFPSEVVDTTGAGDAFAAGVALGIMNNRPLDQIGRIGNALGALSIRALGARAGLPTRAELIEFLGDDSVFTQAEP